MGLVSVYTNSEPAAKGGVMKYLKNYLLKLDVPILIVTFFLFTGGVILQKILSVLFGTNTLWANDSYAAQFFWIFYHILPAILIGSGLVFLVLSRLRQNATKAQHLLLILTVLSCVVSLWWPETLYSGVCLFLGYLSLEKAYTLSHRIAFPRVIPLTYVCYFFLLFSLSAIGCSLLETFMVIWPFCGLVFSTVAFLQYLGLTICLSVMLALETTLLVLLALQVLLVILYALQKYDHISKEAGVFVFLLFHALALALVCYAMAVLAFGDEIYLLSLEYYILLLVLLPALFMAIATWYSLRFLLTSHRHLDLTLADFYFYVLLALGNTLVQRWHRRLPLLLAFFSYAAISLVLVYLNYPIVTDYSAGFCLLLSFIIIGNMAVMLFLAGYRLRVAMPRWVLLLLVLALLLPLPWGSHFYASQDVRTISHEYSKISWAQLQLSHFLLLPEQQTGFGPTTTFSYHPEEYNTYHEKPLASLTPPVFIILFDALRADHTNLLPYARSVTPHMQKLGTESIVFTRAYSCATATTCSLRHIFTGRYSSRFMLEQDRIDPFWVEDLLDSGYRHFVLSVFDSDYNGVSLSAFQRNIPPLKLGQAQFVEVNNYDEFSKVAEALKQLTEIVRTQEKQPMEVRGGIFTYLHFCRSHMPWLPSNPVFGTDAAARYDAAIREADQALGIFLEGLRKLGLYDRAIIIVMADHGTGLMEHGHFGGFLTYEEQIHIPMLWRVPEFAPRVISTPVQSIDVGPTLVNLVADTRDNRFHGISLVGLMRGNPLGSTRQFTFSLCAFEDLVALADGSDYRFHYHRRYGYYKLYDLRKDPEERYNLADSRPESVKNYLRILDCFLRAGNTTYNNPYHYKPWTASQQ